MRLARLITSLVVATVVVALPATAQAAAWPNVATFTDAAGQSNGCTATVDLTIGGPWVGAGGERGLHSEFSVTCPTSANVHRLSYSVRVDRIRPDGTVEVIQPMAPSLTQAYSNPFESASGLLFWSACSTPTFEGTHQWRVRMVVRSKQTVDNSDPSPFVARAQVKRRLTCLS